MTFIELMIRKFPKANLNNLFIDCCPENFGYKTVWTEICRKYGCLADCSKCWDSPVTDGANNIEIIIDSVPLDYYIDKIDRHN